MNLIINPSGQFARVATTFASPNDGDLTLARWRALADGNGKLAVNQAKAPAAIELVWNSAGHAGIAQTIEREEFEASIGDQKLIAFDVWKIGSIDTITVDVVAWSGTANKPTIDPISAWGASLTLSANWTLVATQNFAVTGSRARLTMDPVAIPNAANIAVIMRANGAAGDKVYLTKISMADAAAFPGYNFQREWERCERFFQHYTYEDLYGIEWGFGNARHTGVAHFQFPLRNTLRGRLGGVGVQDISVQWSGLWYSYAGINASAGHYSWPFSGVPNLQCNHSGFLFFAVSLTGVQCPDAVLSYRMLSNGSVSIDAELRP